MTDRHLVQFPGGKDGGYSAGQFDPAWRHGFGEEWSPLRGIGRLWRNLLIHSGFGGVPGGIRPFRYIAPEGKKRHRIAELGCKARESVVAGPVGTYAAGQAVTASLTSYGATLISPPPSGLIGQSGYGISVSPSGDLDSLAVTGVSPSTVDRGTTANVTVTGENFASDDTVAAVVADTDPASLTYGQWVETALVGTSSRVYVDEESFTVDVTVDGAAPLNLKYLLQVSRAT